MDQEKKAIERIKMASEMSLHHYEKPLVCTYSGGKDSDVLLELFKRSGVPFEVNHSHTTVDAPQTVYHVRNKFKELEEQGINCQIQMPVYRGKRVTMWSLIPQKLMPPTRIVRYCCSILKEKACPNSFVATGVRWNESAKRKQRGMFETLANTQKQATRIESEIMLLSDNDESRKLTEHCMKKTKICCESDYRLVGCRNLGIHKHGKN